MSVVNDNEARCRFELVVDGTSAFASYRREGHQIIFTHTVVPKTLEGRGIGKRLIAGALELVRADGLKVIPACPFVLHYFETHPEEQSLLATSVENRGQT